MLPHVGHTDGTVLGCLRHLVHHLTHLDGSLFGKELIADHGLKFLFLERLELSQPLLVRALLEILHDLGECLLHVAHHLHGSLHVLVDLCRVDVEMDHLRLFGIGLQVARYPVVEPHPDGDQHVALICFQVWSHVAMHAQHAAVERMVGGHCREAQDGRGEGYIRFFQESNQLLFSATEEHTLTHQGIGFFGIVDQLGSHSYLLLIHVGYRLVAPQERCLLIVEDAFVHLRILGDVEHHRSGATARGDVERARHRPGDILHAADLVGPLGDGLCDANHVSLLEGI